MGVTQDYLNKHPGVRDEDGFVSFVVPRPGIECNDGFSMSVQASEFHYCRPRDNGGWYTHVEVGFPSELVPEFMEYAEQPEIPTGTVYGWVPIELVDQVIERHGGIKGETE